MGCLIWNISKSFCFFFLFHSQVVFISSLSSLCSQDQSSALLQFKNMFSTNTSPSASPLFPCNVSNAFLYPKTKSWDEGTDCCSWDGVRCDGSTGQVVGLDLSCSQLYGTIHFNSTLFSLSTLQWLNLAFNNFNDTQISSQFGKFKSLTYLNLSNSRFSGPIPPEVSRLSDLVTLDLSSNTGIRFETLALRDLIQNLTKLRELFLNKVDMSSVRLDFFMTLPKSLVSLSISSSGLIGKVQDDVFSLPNLQFLNLSFNTNLTGNLPKSNWGSPLKLLDLSFTNISGELPDSINRVKSLESLHLSNCKFDGTISESLGNLTEITLLDLSYNNFTGHIPPSLLSLQKLTLLDLSQNNFTGSLPNILANLPQLSSLHFSKNQLTGPLPSWLYALPRLRSLDLSSNKFTGKIGEFQYKSLEIINLSINRLDGPIPTSFFGFPNLTSLKLQSNNFSGSVDSEMVSKLKNLKLLDLSHNKLSFITKSNANISMPNLESLSLSSCNISEFPYFLTTSQNLLVLDLSNNKISGTIPQWLYEVGKDTLLFLNLTANLLTSVELLPLKKLVTVDLRSNLLEGPIPILPPATTFFSISNNKMTGEIPLFICNMSSFRILDLSINRLSGKIPECIGNFSNSLSVLDLRINSFHGPLPSNYAKENILRNLDLDGNQLEGPIPKSLINCQKLEVLDLGNNNIEDTFPYWLETLPSLQVLVLRSNKFYGPITGPKSNTSFTKLRIFDLSNNRFTGRLPTEYMENLKGMMNVDQGKSQVQYMGERYCQDTIIVMMKGSETQLLKILTVFTTIDLSNNSFHGKIPEDIGRLYSLRQLNLSHNSLTGHIPTSLGNLSVLEALDLSNNKLKGEIPGQLTGLTFLAVFDLSQNQLSGPIPRGKQFDTFQNISYSGNLGLCGLPLLRKCDDGGGDDEVHNPSSKEDKSSEFDWKVAVSGYGCGIVFGVFMGYLVFSTGKPLWLVTQVEGNPSKKLRRRTNQRSMRRTYLPNFRCFP